MAELTTEQFELLYQRRSQEDLNTIIEMLENEGSVSAPADSPLLVRAQEAQEAEREADKEAGGEGKTAYEQKQETLKAQAEEAKAQAAAAEKEAKAQTTEDTKAKA